MVVAPNISYFSTHGSLQWPVVTGAKHLERAVRWAVPLTARRRLLDSVLGRLDRHGASGTLSYSSTGQDMILCHLIGPGNISGFYVDVGAWQPKIGSNTYALYRRGWSGITIEPRQGSTADFRRHRPRDKHIEIGIGSTPGRFTYRVVSADSSVNSFSADHLARIGRSTSEEYEAEVDRLDSVLARTLDDNQHIDLLAIDTEGSDLDVLESNDWQRFRPALVLVEDSDSAAACDFLRSLGYIEKAAVPIVGPIRDHVFADPQQRVYCDL